MNKAPEPLRRIAAILDAVGFSRDGLSSARIAEVTGLPMPTVHRTLRNLVALGYIRNSGLGTPYTLGDRLRRLAEPGLRNEDIAELAQPVLQRLANEVGCVVGIGRICDFKSETVTEVLPAERGRSLVLSGENLPLHATASGKIFLSMLEARDLDTFMASGLAALRPATIVDPDELRAHLELVRRRGYAMCRDECDPGVYSIAIPIVLPHQGHVFTLGVVDLRERLFERVEEEDLLKIVRTAAQDLMARFTGLRPVPDLPPVADQADAKPGPKSRTRDDRPERTIVIAATS